MKEEQNIRSKIRFEDQYPHMRGILKYTVFKNGVPIETVEDHNLIVNGARSKMAHLAGGDVAGQSITKIAFGTNGVPPALPDTIITNAYEKNMSGHSYPEAGSVQFDWALLVTEDNGQAILEFGLITADATLFSRRTRENPIHKESDISIEGQWTIIF